MNQHHRSWASTLLLAAAAVALLAGCVTTQPHRATAPAPSGLAELMERPAERALVEGIRAYDDGQYPAAEGALKRALDGGLASGRDRATAHKLLAFIACTSAREAECEASFRAARAVDGSFVLSRSETGHPQWGPVAKRALP